MDEVMRLVELYRGRYDSWNMRHFYSGHEREHRGERSNKIWSLESFIQPAS